MLVPLWPTEFWAPGLQTAMAVGGAFFFFVLMAVAMIGTDDTGSEGRQKSVEMLFFLVCALLSLTLGGYVVIPGLMMFILVFVVWFLVTIGNAVKRVFGK